MKRFLFILVSLSIISSTAFAQKGALASLVPGGKHELSVNYGYGTNNLLLGGVIVIGSLGFGHRDLEYTGSIGLEYLYYPIKNIGVGGTFSYEYGHGKSEKDNGVVNRSSHNYLTLMPTAKFYWFNNPRFGMYSRLGAGVTYGLGKYNGEPDNIWMFAFQASAISAEMGSPTVRAFVELGMGSQGILLGGLRVRF